jgi:hypothetical protein
VPFAQLFDGRFEMSEAVYNDSVGERQGGSEKKTYNSHATELNARTTVRVQRKSAGITVRSDFDTVVNLIKRSKERSAFN